MYICMIKHINYVQSADTTHTSDIATNTANIATNAADIDALEVNNIKSFENMQVFL